MDLRALYLSIPATTREPVKSYIISAAYTTWAAVVTLVSYGVLAPEINCCKTFMGTVTFVGHSWWTIVLGIIFGVGPLARARQGLVKARAAEEANSTST